MDNDVSRHVKQFHETSCVFLQFNFCNFTFLLLLQEQKQREEEMRKRDMELDYLAPFLSRIGNPKYLTRQDAFKIKEECLQDLKHRLIDKANLIQARFEKVCIHLKWYLSKCVKVQSAEKVTFPYLNLPQVYFISYKQVWTWKAKYYELVPDFTSDRLIIIDEINLGQVYPLPYLAKTLDLLFLSLLLLLIP